MRRQGCSSQEQKPWAPAPRLTFEVDLDDVVVAHQVPAGQQLRHFGGVGANHVAHPVADDAVGAEAQAGQRVHPEHVLLQEAAKSRMFREKQLLDLVSFIPYGTFYAVFPQIRL